MAVLAMRVGVWKNVSKDVIAQQEVSAGKRGWPEPTDPGHSYFYRLLEQPVDICFTVREMRIVR